MQKNKRLLVSLFMVLIIAAILVPVYISSLYTSFQQVVLDPLQGKEITSLNITRISSEDRKEMIVSDKSTIQQIMNDFAGIQLKKSNKNAPSKYHYYITPVQDDMKHRFGIVIEDSKKRVTIFDNDKSKNRLNSYKITNDFNIVNLENVFK